MKTPFIKKAASRMRSFIVWIIVVTGVVTVMGKFSYEFLTNDVEVSFIKPVGRGYEFSLVNHSPVDQVIESFRVVPDFKQKFIFKINKDVHMKVTNEGVILQGGNDSYVPAFEFKALNGSLVKGNSDVKFRVPPLSSREYLVPESMVVFVEYETKSKNRLMARLEKWLPSLNPRAGVKKVKYLISDNYWTPIKNDNLVLAVNIACRDDDMFSQSSICKKNK